LSYLQKLRSAKTLKDVAEILGFTASSLAYILYKMPDAAKYTSFEIPKRSGGRRQIKAPATQLRLLQRRLANVLYICLEEIAKEGTKHRSFAHGFERKRSIITNASLHKRRRYVLNLDLEDFFPSFNFGRVRGFLIKDKHFALHEKAATIIAQIACHDNELPQGSPCSPIISNLIGHVLDVRLFRLAKAHKCTYSRYADDITFSTNRKEFPPELAVPVPEMPSKWQLGEQLVAKIENSGFCINSKKTRMQYRGSRQVVTGLLVNEKVNVRPEYYRNARAMCHALFATGTCYRNVPASLVEGDHEGEFVKVPISHITEVEGILGHIHHARGSPAWRNYAGKEKPPSPLKLYRDFLFYKSFITPQAPLIVPEGKTDSIYLRAAIKKLTQFHPQLGSVVDGNFSYSVRFMNYTRTVQDVLDIGNGTGAFTKLIATYKNMLKGFGHAPLAHPVILVVDNDDGASKLFKSLKKNGGPEILHTSTELFYRLCKNLYLIKTPEKEVENAKSYIEELFDSKLLNTKVGGKKFDPNKEHEAEGRYGKLIFAERVIKPNIQNIDFSGFSPLLNRIVAVLEDYQSLAAM